MTDTPRTEVGRDGWDVPALAMLDRALNEVWHGAHPDAAQYIAERMYEDGWNIVRAEAAAEPLNLMGQCRMQGPHPHAFIGPHAFNEAAAGPRDEGLRERMLERMAELDRLRDALAALENDLQQARSGGEYKRGYQAGYHAGSRALAKVSE
jgi:hypothetical protein